MHNQPPQPQQQLPSSRPKNTIDSDDEDEEFMRKFSQAKIIQRNQPSPIPSNIQPSNRKKQPMIDTTPQKQQEEAMEIEGKIVHMLRFNELPEEVLFYLTDVFPYGNRLFISGVMPHGQTINFLAVQPLKQIYFCLRSQYSQADVISETTLARAKKQIDSRLFQCGIKDFRGEFQQKQYVFELQGVPRAKRPYYNVRYPFKHQSKDQPKPDWQGQTFRYVFGTTYTPLELFIINSGIKGPAWAKIPKKYLKQNTKNIQYGLCAQLQNAELIQAEVERTKPPPLRVMSISIRAAIPSQVKLKKLFNTNYVDDMHIYAISFFHVDNYEVELKPSKYSGVNKTLFLKQFGAQSKDKTMVLCQDQKQMIALFQAQLRKLDPDVIVCHDTSRVLDCLIQRMMRLQNKTQKPRLGRLVHAHQINKSNQQQRVNFTIAGRLLVDTFIHSKDMIKSVDHQLQEMAKHIKPEVKFTGMNDEQILQYLNANRTMHVIQKAREQAQVTFALMNHLQILQITRQLSNICGNTWKRSLQNQRAERNQYLIMHQCLKRDLIIPDKYRKYKDDEDDDQPDRKKYQGGHVIDPMKGFYKDFILLLDFNSLYPSIIRQYNVCFSVIKRPLVPIGSFYRSNKQKKEKKYKNNEQQPMEIQQQQVVPPPKQQCIRQKWGFLPQLIDKIVDRRKRCRKAMKGASAQKVIILDIQQKCYKLVANSIYGCLGFSISRFYSKHLAALITRMGRQALLRAKDIVGTMGGVRVIYGDTDSLMIQPTGIQDRNGDKEKLFQIRKVADQLKGRINQEYKNLQIDVDGIFKPLILLMKKKYVARKLTNYDKVVGGVQSQLTWNNEYKGIQVVRRDGFQLQRAFLKHILQILMQSKATEPQQTYQQIYSYAKSIGDKFQKGIKYEDLLFSKQLNKHPKQYQRGETIPHVKVALDRLKAGQRPQALVNHTIYYIVCKAKSQLQDSLSKCCFDSREYQRSQKFADQKGPLEIDQEYYKRELVQPVWRVTQHLDDFSTEKFMEELGLEHKSRKQFRRMMEMNREEGEVVMETAISNNTAQKCKKFNEMIGQIACLCGQKMLATDKGRLVHQCPNCSRSVVATISNRLTALIKQKSTQYYNNKFKCRCGKEYLVNLITDCCKIRYKPRSNIPFELHELVYVAKDVCEITLKEIRGKLKKESQIVSSEDRKMMENYNRLLNLENKIDGFFRASDFEKIGGLVSLLKM